jgi:phosphoribosylformylglycinamidine synthase
VFHASITVTLRRSILDPQGKAVEHGVHALGYPLVTNVRIGKFIDMDIATESREEAERIVQEVSHKLLANPVMEDFSYTLEHVQPASSVHV